MKTLMITPLVALLFAVTAVNAQYGKQIQSTQTEVFTIDEQADLNVKTIVEEKQYLEVEAQSPAAINQNVKDTPVMITETVLIDNDSDQDFEKKIVIHYIKKDDATIEYEPTADGIVLTKAANKKSLIATEGDYILETTDYENLVIEVEDME